MTRLEWFAAAVLASIILAATWIALERRARQGPLRG